MNLLYALVAFMIALVAVFVGVSRVNAWFIERRNPPVGSFALIDRTRIHYAHVPAPSGAELPPVVFIHGASANLKDQMIPLQPLLEGRAEMLFFDRPGHGWSARGPLSVQTPFDQAKTLASLMDHVGIESAIIVGHSLGGSLAAAFALAYPQKVRGIVFISPATHPWPGGETSWYYALTAKPFVGRLFAEAIAGPAGALSMAAATKCVFAPNPIPEEYLDRASIRLVLRASAFRANARDVEGLYRHAVATAPLYKNITAPAVIISGDHDTVVAEEIHSRGMARDIAGAELVWVRNLGHKPDWIAPELVVGAIETLAGQPTDLQALGRAVEARIAADDHGARCANPTFPDAELAPT
jgi:pimeloyl-ACP methyl ester carboxylesterase